jgi:hypothetical protein
MSCKLDNSRRSKNSAIALSMAIAQIFHERINELYKLKKIKVKAGLTNWPMLCAELSSPLIRSNTCICDNDKMPRPVSGAISSRHPGPRVYIYNRKMQDLGPGPSLNLDSATY